MALVFPGKYVAAIRRLTPHNFPGLDGMVPEARYNGGFAAVTSECCQFDWCQCVWCMDPKQEKHLGRWIGVAKDIGGPMTFWILPKSGTPLPRSSVTPLMEDEKGSDGVRGLMKALDEGPRPKPSHLPPQSLPGGPRPLDWGGGGRATVRPGRIVSLLHRVDGVTQPSTNQAQRCPT